MLREMGKRTLRAIVYTKRTLRAIVYAMTDGGVELWPKASGPSQEPQPAPGLLARVASRGGIPALLLGLIGGAGAFVVELAGAVLAGLSESWPLIVAAYLPFPVVALFGGTAADRPTFQKGLAIGLSFAVIGWIAFFATAVLDVILFGLPPIGAWLGGLLFGRERRARA